MKFKIKDKTDYSRWHGNIRNITYFAWMPIVIEDDCRWLENVTIEQVFKTTIFGKEWENQKFID